MIVKHTLLKEDAASYKELMQTIMNCNLDIRIEEDYDSWLLIGDQDHIEYLVTECY